MDHVFGAQKQEPLKTVITFSSFILIQRTMVGTLDSINYLKTDLEKKESGIHVRVCLDVENLKRKKHPGMTVVGTY